MWSKRKSNIVNKINEAVNLVIKKIAMKDIYNEDDISVDLGARLENQFPMENKIAIDNLNAKYRVEFRYIKTPRGAWKIRIGGMDIIWVIGIKILSNKSPLYARIKGAKLQAKKCACINGELSTNDFGKWLKENPHSLWESCKRMNKKRRLVSSVGLFYLF